MRKFLIVVSRERIRVFPSKVVTSRICNMCEGDKSCLHCEQLQLFIAAQHGRCGIEVMGG